MMCEVMPALMTPPPRLPLLVTEHRAWYFGPWGRPGHYLHDQDGRRIWSTVDCPFAGSTELDGFLAPVRSPGFLFPRYRLEFGASERAGDEYPQGKFLIHRRTIAGELYTIAAWWDRTQGDTRPSSNACLIVAGRRPAVSIPELLGHYFPLQHRNLARAGVRLESVSTVHNYDPEQVSITFQGVEITGFMDGTFIEVEKSTGYPEYPPKSLLNGTINIEVVDGPEFS